MPARRINPNCIKLNRSYSISELAARLVVHKNTVRQWQRTGLQPVDTSRPLLFQGAVVRAFLAKRNTARKRPCPPGTLYCFKCREPRPPALGMLEYVPANPTTGNLRAICGTCDTIMHRRTRLSGLATIMPNFAVQMVQAPQRLCGSPMPSLNCDLERHATT